MANIALKVGIDVSKAKFDTCRRSGGAVANKLLKQAFAIIKNDTFFDENHISSLVN